MGSVSHTYSVYKARCITLFRVDEVEISPEYEAYARVPDICTLERDDIIIRVTGVPSGAEAELKGLLEMLTSEDLKAVLARARMVGKGVYVIDFKEFVDALKVYFDAAEAIIAEAVRRVEGCKWC